MPLKHGEARLFICNKLLHILDGVSTCWTVPLCKTLCDISLFIFISLLVILCGVSSCWTVPLKLSVRQCVYLKKTPFSEWCFNLLGSAFKTLCEASLFIFNKPLGVLGWGGSLAIKISKF